MLSFIGGLSHVTLAVMSLHATTHAMRPPLKLVVALSRLRSQMY